MIVSREIFLYSSIFSQFIRVWLLLFISRLQSTVLCFQFVQFQQTDYLWLYPHSAFNITTGLYGLSKSINYITLSTKDDADMNDYYGNGQIQIQIHRLGNWKFGREVNNADRVNFESESAKFDRWKSNTDGIYFLIAIRTH